MVTKIWINIVSGKGLLPTAPSNYLNPDVDWLSKVHCGINLKAISQEVTTYVIVDLTYRQVSNIRLTLEGN